MEAEVGATRGDGVRAAREVAARLRIQVGGVAREVREEEAEIVIVIGEVRALILKGGVD